MGLNKRLIDQAGGAAGVTGTDNFAPVLYTGNSSTQSISSLDFQPDLVLIKGRNIDYPTHFFDSIRGATKYILSSRTDSETTISNSLTSFNSNGFSLGANFGTNRSPFNFVAWCWKAGGAAVSGTGTNAQNITYSANPDAGFSIVKFSSNGSSSYTASHGLNQEPDLVITKATTAGANWISYAKALGTSKYLFLDTSATAGTYSNLWNGMSSTNIGGSSAVYGGTNTFINYCFHSVDGYQKVGSYSGTGSAGQTITTGFQPRFVMIKATNNASDWYLIDSVRPNNKFLIANGENTEFTASDTHTFTSTGFTLSGSSYNNSGYDWIYLAIA